MGHGMKASMGVSVGPMGVVLWENGICHQMDLEN